METKEITNELEKIYWSTTDKATEEKLYKLIKKLTWVEVEKELK